MAEGGNQVVVRPTGQTMCVHHRTQPLVLYCVQCDDLVCALCMSTVHEGHKYANLSEVISERKREIASFIDVGKNTKLVQIQQEINSGYDMLKKDTAKNVTMHIEELEKRRDSLNGYLDGLQKVIQTGSDIEVFDTRCDLQGLALTIPDERTTESTNSSANITRPSEHLTQALGKIVIEEASPTQASGKVVIEEAFPTQASGKVVIEEASPIQASGKVVIEEASPTQASGKVVIGEASSVLTTGHSKGQPIPSTDRPASSTRQTSPASDGGQTPDSKPQNKDDTRIVREFTSPCYIQAVCVTSDGAWTKCDDMVTLITQDGEVIQEMKHNTDILDVRVSPITNNVWTCSDDRSIMECTPPNTPVVRFRTGEKPYSLCCTQDGCIIVGTSKRITKFDTNGKILCTTSSGSFRPLVCSPKRITECSVTQNIAVVDRDYSRDGGTRTRRVVVLGADFQELFQYTGNLADRDGPRPRDGGKRARRVRMDTPSSQQTNMKRKERPFDPVDARYDTVGNIVIADGINGCLKLLSGSGEYMRLLHTDSDMVWCIGIDKENILWAGFSGKIVKQLQYYL